MPLPCRATAGRCRTGSGDGINVATSHASHPRLGWRWVVQSVVCKSDIPCIAWTFRPERTAHGAGGIFTEGTMNVSVNCFQYTNFLAAKPRQYGYRVRTGFSFSNLQFFGFRDAYSEKDNLNSGWFENLVFAIFLFKGYHCFDYCRNCYIYLVPAQRPGYPK